jgi:putative transcriptional regulator
MLNNQINVISRMNSLQNHILIAMPHMVDPYFGKAVIYICEHTKDGAMGLVINRPFMEPDLKKLFTEIYEDNENILKIVPRVHFGGPVMIERGIVLHSTDHTVSESVKIADTIAMTSHKDILGDISKKKGPKSFKLFLGHSGWGSGQLEKEIERGDWLLQNTTPDFIFDVPEKYMWGQAARTLGVETNDSASIGGHA